MKATTASLLILLGLATAQAVGKDGFVTIFDGKTLKGWEATPAKTASMGRSTRPTTVLTPTRTASATRASLRHRHHVLFTPPGTCVVGMADDAVPMVEIA